MTPPPFRRIGLFAKVDDPATSAVVAEVLRVLGKARCEVMVERHAAALAPSVETFTAPEIAAQAELVIVVGGDGTLLAAARALDWATIPLIGINLGRLGFLADVRPGAPLAEELGAVLAGRYTMDKRLMLHAELGGDSGQSGDAVNDVVVKRRDGSRLLELEAWVGDIYLSRTRADGLIVTGPTGSTAYSLSAGGPILAPELASFAIVPICPHGLGERPVVVPADAPIRIRPALDGGETAEVVLDGQITLPLAAGGEVRVARSAHELLLLHPPGYEYFATLREKLGWGGRAPKC
ncbi:MAG: NAD(+)/NADH kinase [Gammaproteobacteria bacterium]